MILILPLQLPIYKFYRINKNLPSHQELFAEKGHHMTCMDPELELQIDSSTEDFDEKKQETKIHMVNQRFEWKHSCLSEYD